ncbi:hypothetical protein HOM13_02710 [Candidatus Woesearchaeota archaeon]|jgi:hypothetical protein|nr:hypothetical protein [Candidatus Woesearchaeota archaeon]MBT5215625.1 hypothetical protein [Candidatus Woesearchaeota archaeon]MBT6401949.1 hypothetical protein [Candidatus Woesearchaeota archaeon]
MVHRIKEEDIHKSSRFLKKNDPKRKGLKLKEISNFLNEGHVSEIISEENFAKKNKKSINVFAHTIIYKNKKSRINNIVISPKTTERDLFELIINCIDYLIRNGSKEIELNAPSQLEEFFKNMKFEKIGLKNNSVLMKYTVKSDKQSSLSKKFEEAEMLKNISEKTSEQLLKQR